MSNQFKQGQGATTMRVHLQAPSQSRPVIEEREPYTVQPFQPVEKESSGVRQGQTRSFISGKSLVAMGIIALAAGAFCLRFLPNNGHSAYMDEASQILAGRYLIEKGMVYASILNWSYGSYLWPLISGSLDILGGLTLVRAFTALCGMVMTLATFFSAYRLAGMGFTERQRWAVAFLAGLIMAIMPTSIGLGDFGTYDSLAGATFMVGVALLLPVQGRAQRFRLAAAFVLFFLAFLAKYVIAIYFPVICLYLIFSAGNVRKAIGRILWFVGPLTLACAVYFLLFRSELTNLLSFSRSYTDLKSNDPFLVYVWERPELWLLAGVATFGWQFATRQGKLVALGGTAIILAFQAFTRPDFDFWKHSIYIIFFLAPLASLALVRALTWLFWKGRFNLAEATAAPANQMRMAALSAGMVGIIIGSIVLSLAHASLLVTFYPNLTPALPAIKQNLPGVQTVLTDDIAVRYYLYPTIPTDKVTDPFYIAYNGMSGLDAYRQSITDRYYDLIILDGGVGPIGQQISTQLKDTINQHYNKVASQAGPKGTTVELYKPRLCVATPSATNSKVYDFSAGIQGWGGHPQSSDFQVGNQVTLSQEQTCGDSTSLKYTRTDAVPMVGVQLNQPGQANQPVKTIKAMVFIEPENTNNDLLVIGMAGFDQNWQWHDDGFKQAIPLGRWEEITWQLPSPVTFNEADLVFPKEAKTIYISHVEVAS